MLLITYTEELVDGKPLYVSSNCLPAKRANLEPAGHAFHDAVLRLAGHVAEVESSDDDEKEVSKAKESGFLESDFSSKNKKKSGEGKQQQDHYALLGLGHLRYLSTEDQIRKSYREAALRHHPDKQAVLLLAEKTEAAKEAKKEEIETNFRAIQEAYEVLIDPARRRVYDSTDEFDDEIPSDCSPEDFYKVFGPAFMRNGRWSVTQPAQMLGDDSTPINEVDSFYNFWYSFKSWREFPTDDDHDLEQAESREEKRWMEKQNAKLSEKARKLDVARIRTLVDNAYKKDPRIARRKEELKAEKQRKKDAKLLAKKLEEEEAARIAEEERLRKEEEDKKAAEIASNMKKNKEKEKKLLRKERTRLRTLSTPIISQKMLGLTNDNVENLCSTLEKDSLTSLCDRMEAKEGLERAKVLKNALESSDDKLKEEKEVEKSNGSVAVNKEAAYIGMEKKEKPWGKEEIELLRKGIVKYPKGTSRRWEVISEYIGTSRSVEEILKATKTVLLQKPDTAKAFDSFLEKRKPAGTIASPLSTREELGLPINVADNKNTAGPENTNSDKTPNGPAANGPDSVQDADFWSVAQEKSLIQALKSHPKDAPQRWEHIAIAVRGKTMAQCKKKFVLMRENFKNNSSVPEKTTPEKKTTDNQKDDIKDSSSSPSKKKIEVSEVSNVPSENGFSSSSDASEIWSEVQEKALVKALKTFPKETNQRWERIVEAVPGKTMNQCKKKFASLKEDFRSKKNTA